MTQSLWNTLVAAARLNAGMSAPSTFAPQIAPSATPKRAPIAPKNNAARNTLRTHLAAYGQELPILAHETGTALRGKALEAAGRAAMIELDSRPIVPTEAHRVTSSDPRPLMRDGNRPLRSKHYGSGR